MLEVAVLLVRALVALFRPKRDLVLENMVLRHQLQVALRTNPRPVLHDRDRIWVRHVWPGSWYRHLAMVRPETVIGWHRKESAKLCGAASD